MRRQKGRLKNISRSRNLTLSDLQQSVITEKDTQETFFTPKVSFSTYSVQKILLKIKNYLIIPIGFLN